jgi:hypothetical protein
MARVLDANAMFAGGEPKFTEEMTRIQLIESLNWYSANRDYKDAIKYIGDYLNKKLKLKVPERIIKKQTTTFGWVCRLLYNGATLPQENQKYFNDTLETIKKGDGQVDEIVEDVTVVATVNPSIQDRIKESTSRIIAELDGLVDDFTLNAYRETKTPKGMMTELSTKGVHVKAIVEHYKKVRSEISDAIAGADEQLVEGYSHMKKTELKRFESFLSKIIDDALTLQGEAKQNRKPRKRKVKTADELIGKMKYCVEDIELGLKSIDPKSVIGASTLWVFNIKTRKLGCYIAEDISGLSLKGTTIQNFVDTKSVQKKLRKPEVILPEIASGGKVFLRNVIEGVRAVESKLSGRINGDTILLRVIK